jgi:hypothetical protein
MECDNGITLHLRTDHGDVALHSDMPSGINFVSYVATLTGEVPCGTFTPPPHVIVVYRRGSDTAYLGEPLAVEFRE